ncbi:MAG: peptide chain release factor N(5)-glutamine methyltransferase [Alphaproteobacteria bacterium]
MSVLLRGDVGGTVEQALTTGAMRLCNAGVKAGRRDALLLLAAALKSDPNTLRVRPERSLDAAEWSAFESLLDRRAGREPVSRILGTREFWSLPFKITPDTLDPRPDSETLVDAVLARIGDRGAAIDILDLGTGSGCLLLALLSELPAARGLGVDISEAALTIARQNAVALGLAGRADFLCASWGHAVGGAWQVIVSNPPYILLSEIPDLAPEVQDFDPPLALAGGPDGLDAYRALAPEIARLMAPGGLAALEIEMTQTETIEALLRAAGLQNIGRERDLAGNWRCLLAGNAGQPADWRK